MRLAWFSPMPPARTGVAAVSAALVPALGAAHTIDVFADVPIQRGAGPLRSAHEFVWLHRLQPYDLTVYQLGNSAHHDFQWPYVFRYPGLAVLHDAHLHHARAACLLKDDRADDYRAELYASHPDAPDAVAELAVAGFANNLYYHWPMTRLVVAASRLTAVHTPLLAARLRADVPGSAVEAIRLGHATLRDGAFRKEARRRVRAERGIPGDTVVFGIFGGLTPEKRVPQVLEALAATRHDLSAVHLLLAGAPVPHYDVAADVRARGLDAAVTLTGYLRDDEELDAHIAACDVALTLRWPTAREVSGPWLRALAAGVPTVITDLEHLSDVPTVRMSGAGIRASTRSGRPQPVEGLDSGFWTRPVSLAVDIAHEQPELQSAMKLLATDAALREQLGAAGQRYWEREHSPDVMAEDYRRVIAAAAVRPAPQPVLPRHLVDQGDARLRAIVEAFDDETVRGRLATMTGDRAERSRAEPRGW